MICPDCESATPDGESFCPGCGCRLPVIPRAPVVSPSSAKPEVSVAPAETGLDPWAEEAGSLDLAFEGSRGRRTITLSEGDQLEVGRSVGPISDLCTDNISSAHAEFAVRNSIVEVRDTGHDLRGSTNGTFIAGRRLPPNVWTPLIPSVTVHLGSDPPLAVHITRGDP